ncbi:MAG: hypothetical protein K9I84_11255 [Leadbetterella sp.]|nr:hypothetical protein [Leadbetterella sp.]
MEVQLLTQSQIKSEFKNLIEHALIIKGIVAYWTWDRTYVENEFGANFFDALRHNESFYCIDISSTVSKIDNIASCCDLAENFYIYTYKLKDTKTGDENRVSLLHSKITYIETAEGYFVFVGSHNNTKNAFNGFNMEHSLLLKFPLKISTKDSQLLDDILLQLNRVKLMCYKFNNKLVDFYKGLQITDQYFLPRVVLKFEDYQISDIRPNNTISIISLNDLIPNAVQYDRNIKDKKILVVICNKQQVKRVFTAFGEADDKVAKYEMDEKVTESDYVALSINGFSDPLGIPYLSFNSIKYKKIKGSSLNFSEHVIHRFKIIEEIYDLDRVKNFTGIPKKINFYRDITDSEFKSLNLDEEIYSKKDINKIDENMHSIEYLGMEKYRLLKKAKSHANELKYNTDDENVSIIDKKLKEIFEIIMHNNEYDISNRDTKKLQILSILSDVFHYKDKSYQNSEEESIRNMQDAIMNYIEENKRIKSTNNKLSQFSGKFYKLTDQDLHILRSNNS